MMRLLEISRQLRQSLWFVPGMIVLGMVGLALILIDIDAGLKPGALADWQRLFGASPEGARGLLSTVAGSMITVAGVVFSITLVALSLASSQYSTRVLRNFMDDRTNQAVLGVFVGIFAYCLIVLRTIRGTDGSQFVPSIAVLGGLILAFLGIGFLVFFIHHIAVSIQAAAILTRLRVETIRSVEYLFPETLGEEPLVGDADDPCGKLESDHWQPIAAHRTGYVTSVDAEGLLGLARNCAAVIRMERGVGEFVIEGAPLASVNSRVRFKRENISALLSAFGIGQQRTMSQDATFGVHLIVDIALKALSPAVNNPATAVIALDQLSAILVRVANRKIESPCRFDSDKKTLRVIATGPTFALLVKEALSPIREYSGGSSEVIARLIDTLSVVEGETTSPGRRDVLLEHVRIVEETIHQTVRLAADRERLLHRAAPLAKRLSIPDQQRHSANPVAQLG